MNPKTTALIWRFALMFAIGEGPAVINALSTPDFNWRLLALGLVTGALGVLEKMNAPQLANVYLPAKAIPPVPPPAG